MILENNKNNVLPSNGGHDTPADLDVSISRVTNCRYYFVFTLREGDRSIKSAVVRFSLDNGFANPDTINPSSELSYTKPNGTWTITNFGSSSTRQLTFYADYTGLQGRNIIPSQTVTGVVTFERGGTGTVTEPVTTTTVADCTETPCCEAYNGQTLFPVTLNPCDDYVPVSTDVAVAPKGKKIAVNLNFPAVCDTKDVNVGVYLTETTTGTEVPFAHKVIRRSAAAGGTGTCLDDRDCNCVEFFIDDYADTAVACATPRTFNVRVKAHYIDQNLTTDDDCSCNGNS